MLPNLTTDRFLKDRDFFTAKVKEQGGEVLLADGQDNDKLQIKQAEELINQGAKVLVVMSINLNSAAAIVRYAHSKNVKVIAYERIIQNCDVDYFVSFDNVKIGELMADYAVKKVPEGNYFILGGDKADKNAVWVKTGFMNIIGPLVKSGKIKIIYDTFVEDWSGENAYHEMKKYLDLSANARPDVVLSAYDGFSTGTIKAFDENNITTYPVLTGQNAELESCQNIVKGKQSMTVYKSIKREAEQGALLAIKCVKNERVENVAKTTFNGKTEVPSILIDPVGVDATNMKSTVIAEGFLKESDVYKQN